MPLTSSEAAEPADVNAATIPPWRSDYPGKRLHSGLWAATSSKSECRMTLGSYTEGELFLQSRDRDELQLVLNVPFRQNTLEDIRLSWIPQTWQQGFPPVLLAQGIVEKQGKAVFSHNVRQLADRLRQGHWAQIATNTHDGGQLAINISPIDFRDPFKTFNACRNQLPPVRLERVKNTSVFFASGSSALSTDVAETAGRDALDRIISYLAYAPKTVSRITIDGYSDSTGNHLHNLDLSRHRARAVADYLIAAGVDRQLLQTVRHHGQRYPLADNNQATGRNRNRRVDIRLFTDNEPDVASHEATAVDAKADSLNPSQKR